MFPTALMLTPHCHPALPLLWSYDPLCGYDCSIQGESGTQDYWTAIPPTTFKCRFISEILMSRTAYLTCWHLGFYIDILTTYLYFNGAVVAPLTGTASLTLHLITNVSPGQTHLMDININHSEASHCLGHNDFNKEIRLQVMVTCYSQVTVA